MKILISIVILVAVIMGGFKLWDYWDETNRKQEATEQLKDGADINEYALSGMPWQLEQPYSQAKQKGVVGVKEFMEKYGKAPKFEDPRKAWVELDYAVLILGSDPVEAKRLYLDVKSRISTNAPIYRRIRAMSKTFE